MTVAQQKPGRLPQEPMPRAIPAVLITVIFILNVTILGYAVHVALPGEHAVPTVAELVSATGLEGQSGVGGVGGQLASPRTFANVALPSRPETERLFIQHCAACHGLDGRGRGPAAEQLYPKPRDFVESPFRFASTTGDEDEIFAALERTIQQGVPRSAMPGFGGVLTESQIAGLARHVLGLRVAQGGLAAGELHVDIGRHPPLTPALRERGGELYTSLGCITCHGESGHGDGPGSMGLIDSTNRPVRPGDLASGLYKSGQSAESIARTILAGVPGTPMTPFEQIVIKPTVDGSKDATELWALVAYILSLAPRPQPPGIASGAVLPVISAPDAAMLDDPSHIGWLGVRETLVSLRPLWQREEQTTVVHVRAVVAEGRIAICLDWEDASMDLARDIATYPDSTAVMFALGSEVPALPMGVELEALKPTEPVNIWHWQADRQYNAAANERIAAYEPRQVPPDRWYMFRGPGDSHVPPVTGRNAVMNFESVARESRYDTAGAVGNVLAQPSLMPHAVLEANALGFGTLTLQPVSEQATYATAAWSDGVWRTVLTRSLTTGDRNDVQFDTPRDIPVAFAVWNGSKGDHAGVKLISGWHWLVIKESTR